MMLVNVEVEVYEEEKCTFVYCEWLGLSKMRPTSLVAACGVAAAAASNVVRSTFPNGELYVDVASASSFRLGVRFDGWEGDALPSPSLDPARQPAPSTPVSWGNLAGLQTSFGALLIATDGSGSWALYDENNNTLVSSGGVPWQNNASGNNVDYGIVLPVNGTAASAGPSRSSNCLGNGDFGPPYYYNRDGGYLSFSVASWDYDPDFPHCYPTGACSSLETCIPRHAFLFVCRLLWHRRLPARPQWPCGPAP